MRPHNVSGCSGQTSLEVLFVVAFTIVIALGVALPYVTNQTITNVSIQTKLAILPLIEKNAQLVHISTIQPEVMGNDLVMVVNTKGAWDGSNHNAYCSTVCSRIDPDNYYAGVSLHWVHNDIDFCSLDCP